VLDGVDRVDGGERSELGELALAEPERLIPRHGGYRKLKSDQVAQLVYHVTVRSCDRYIGRRSRTHNQMVQAARREIANRSPEVAAGNRQHRRASGAEGPCRQWDDAVF
jgi:hypothetical protein